MTRVAGLTLIELVITISLAALLGIPTGLLVGEHLRVGIRSRDSMVATQLARRELEYLDSLNDFFHAEMNSGVFVNYQGVPYTLTRTVTCINNCTAAAAANRQGYKRIVVTVTKPGSSDPLARLITYRTKYVLFGS